jgi:hypothetical protein
MCIAEMLQKEAQRLASDSDRVRSAVDAVTVLCLNDNCNVVNAPLKACMLTAMREDPNCPLDDKDAVLEAGRILKSVYYRSSQLIHDGQKEVLIDGDVTRTEERLVRCVADALQVSVRIIASEQDSDVDIC